MSTPALNKIAATSPSRQSPSELETSIANALYDLETNIADMKGALRPLQFVSAREVRPTPEHAFRYTRDWREMEAQKRGAVYSPA